MTIQLLTAKDVGRRLSVSQSSVYRLHETGLLRASHNVFHGPKGLRWDEQDVELYLRQHTLDEKGEIDNAPPFVAKRFNPKEAA